MKKTFRFLALTLALMVGIATGAYATANNEAIQALLSHDITIQYNGETQTMKNATGRTVYPVVYQGTTYLPVRAVAGMLGVPVDWDGNTQTVYLGTKPQTPAVVETPAPSGQVTAESLVNNAINTSADSYKGELKVLIDASRTAKGMTVPVSVSIVSNIEKSGNLIHNYNNTSVIAAGQNATDGSEVYIKTENGVATTYTKGADGKFVATFSAPMTPAGQAWGAKDFMSLNLSTKQNGYVVTGKANAKTLESLGINNLFGAATGDSSMDMDMNVTMDFDSNGLLKTLSISAPSNGTVTYLQITMTISGYGSTTISLPQELQ